MLSLSTTSVYATTKNPINVETQTEKSMIYGDSLRDTLDNWNAYNEVTINSEGTKFGDDSNIKSKYPAFLNEGVTYSIRFTYRAHDWGPSEVVFRADSINSSDSRVFTSRIAGNDPRIKYENQTFTPKKTGFYQLYFGTGKQKVAISVCDFSISL